MLIDKSKFLVLVAAISASATACVIKETEGTGGGGGSTSDGGGGAGGSTSDGGSTADGGGGAGGGTGGEGGGAACLGDTGTPDACSSECEADEIPGGISTCEGVRHLRAGVAEAAVDCFNALDEMTCSSYMDGYMGCYLESLALACHDPAVESTCTTLATTCSTTDDADWQAECSKHLSGLAASGRTIVVDCLESFCESPSDLEFCVYNAYADFD